MHLEAKGCQGFPKPPDTGKGARTRFSLRGSRKNQLCWQFGFRFLASGTVGKWISVVSATPVWSFVTAALGKPHVGEGQEVVHVTPAHIHWPGLTPTAPRDCGPGKQSLAACQESTCIREPYSLCQIHRTNCQEAGQPEKAKPMPKDEPGQGTAAAALSTDVLTGHLCLQQQLHVRVTRRGLPLKKQKRLLLSIPSDSNLIGLRWDPAFSTF